VFRITSCPYNVREASKVLTCNGCDVLKRAPVVWTQYCTCGSVLDRQRPVDHRAEPQALQPRPLCHRRPGTSLVTMHGSIEGSALCQALGHARTQSLHPRVAEGAVRIPFCGTFYWLDQHGELNKEGRVGWGKTKSTSDRVHARAAAVNPSHRIVDGVKW
jgi:hypothetical protein